MQLNARCTNSTKITFIYPNLITDDEHGPLTPIQRFRFIWKPRQRSGLCCIQVLSKFYYFDVRSVAQGYLGFFVPWLSRTHLSCNFLLITYCHASIVQLAIYLSNDHLSLILSDDTGVSDAFLVLIFDTIATEKERQMHFALTIMQTYWCTQQALYEGIRTQDILHPTPPPNSLRFSAHLTAWSDNRQQFMCPIFYHYYSINLSLQARRHLLRRLKPRDVGRERVRIN